MPARGDRRTAASAPDGRPEKPDPRGFRRSAPARWTTASARAKCSAAAWAAISDSSALSQSGSALSSSRRLRWRMAFSISATGAEWPGMRVVTSRSRKRRRSLAGPVNSPSMLGRQPEQAQIVAHFLDGAGIGAVDANAAAAFVGGAAGADIDRAVRRLDGRGNRPGLIAERDWRGFERRAAQPTAGRQQRHCFQQIGLAGAIGAVSTRWRPSRSRAALW